MASGCHGNNCGLASQYAWLMPVWKTYTFGVINSIIFLLEIEHVFIMKGRKKLE